ncbi:50S ribosomal protein L21e [Candidatus Woesearchaeota archaeon]|nr:50S ribosomal protein L21e [Candidatus Woesearchaeota archaeon]
MVQRIGGFRRKTRFKLQKPLRQKGKISITNYIATFAEGEKVVLNAEPSVTKGMYFPRFHGKAGIVKAKRGTCYEIEIRDGSVIKTMIVHPVHLKKVI